MSSINCPLSTGVLKGGVREGRLCIVKFGEWAPHIAPKHSLRPSNFILMILTMNPSTKQSLNAPT